MPLNRFKSWAIQHFPYIALVVIYILFAANMYHDMLTTRRVAQEEVETARLAKQLIENTAKADTLINRSPSILKIDGHLFIVNPQGGIVHHPDCPCLKSK